GRAAGTQAFGQGDGAAKAARLAKRAYTQKQCALRPCRRKNDPPASRVLAQCERPPAAVTSSNDDDGGWYDERSRLSARDLLHDIKRRGAALFEIAECEDAGAKLCECPALGQCKTAHLLRCLFSLLASILRQLCSGFHWPLGQCCTW